MRRYESRPGTDRSWESSREWQMDDRSDVGRYPDEEQAAPPPIEEESSSLSRLLGYGALAAGAYMGLRPWRHQIADALGRAGRTSYDNTIGLARNALADMFMPGIRQHVDGVLIGARRHYAGKRVLAEPDLVRDLERTFHSFGALHRGWADFAVDSGTMGDKVRDQYARMYGASREVSPGVLQLTVQEILGQPSIRQRFSDRAITVLERGRRLGVIHGEQVVSRGFDGFGVLRQGDRILDSSWASPHRMGRALQRAGQKLFRIGSFHPTDLLFGVINPLLPGNRPLTSTVGNNRLLPNGRMSGGLLNVAVGDEVFSLVAGQRRFESVAKGVQVLDTEIPGAGWLANAMDSMAGGAARHADHGLPKAAGRWSGLSRRFQETTGVGPAYRVRKSLVETVHDAVYRARHGTFRPHRYVAAKDEGATFLERMRFRAQRHIMFGSEEQYALNEARRFRGRRLGPIERLKALFGDESLGSYHTGNPRVDGSPSLRTPQGRTPLSHQPGVQRTRAPIGRSGSIAVMTPASGAVLAGGRATIGHAVGHHLTTRLNDLFGLTFGLGFRPTPGRWGWAGNLAKIYGISWGLQQGMEQLKYLDYLGGQALSLLPGLDDTRPSQYALKAYSKLMVARQKVREGLGIQQGAEYAEGLMPGSMDLPGSWIARTVLPGLVGALRGGRAGLLAGVGLSAAIGGSDVQMPASELERVYSGDKLEAVGRGRWWFTGLQPWAGDKVSHYAPNWVARYLSDYRYTDTQYGSMGEYFSHASAALTPHNLFGLRNVFGGDYYAQKQYYDRPYPFDSDGNPMHEGEGLPTAPTLGVGEAAALGYSAHTIPEVVGQNPGQGLGRLQRQVAQITELAGVYKFMFEQLPFYSDVFGELRPEQSYAAQAGTITSATREYYDAELGGMAMLSELPRRLMGYDKGRQGANSIPNRMPDWLPGQRSAFGRDRTSPQDFTLGDPYARIKGGEYRLPGPGYESIRPLHSESPGVYDAVDRYLILADIAPWSESFRHHQAIVQSWMNAGALDSAWTRRVQEAEEQILKRRRGNFSPRRFSGVKSGTVEELAAVNRYSEPEKAIGAAWEVLTHDVVPGVGRLVPIAGTILDRKLLGQRSAYESFRDDHVYGTPWHDWTRPYDSFVRARAHTLASRTPLEAVAGGVGLSMITSPGIAALSALGLGAASTARMAITGEATGGYIPGHVMERRAEERYFDALEYTRMSRASQAAASMGDQRLARYYSRAAGRTTIGASVTGEEFLDVAPYRLPRHMRPFAQDFLDAPAESRQAILSMAPGMTHRILMGGWAQQDGEAPQSEAPADVRAAEILEAAGGAPGDSWAGWNPGIPMKALKVRTLDSVHGEGYDAHYHDIWELDRFNAHLMYGDVDPAFSEPFPDSFTMPFGGMSYVRPPEFSGLPAPTEGMSLAHRSVFSLDALMASLE